MPRQTPAVRVSASSSPGAGGALVRRAIPRAVCRTPQAPPVPGNPAVHPPSQGTRSRKRKEEAQDAAGGQQPQDLLHSVGPLEPDATGEKELERPLEGLVRNAAETGPRRGVLVGKQLDPPGAVAAADPPDRSPAELALPVVDEEAGSGAVRATGSVSHGPHPDRRADALRRQGATTGESRGPRTGGALFRDVSGRHRPLGPLLCRGPRALHVGSLRPPEQPTAPRGRSAPAPWSAWFSQVPAHTRGTPACPL